MVEEEPSEWDVPAMSDAERDRRWKLIREVMTAKNIDCLIIAGSCANYNTEAADINMCPILHYFTIPLKSFFR